MSYLPICYNNKFHFFKLEPTKVSGDYLKQLKKELIEYQRIQNYQYEIKELKNYGQCTEFKDASLELIQKDIYENLKKAKNIEQALTEKEYQVFIQNLKDEFKIDDVSLTFYRGLNEMKYYEFENVPVQIDKEILYNTNLGFVPIKQYKTVGALSQVMRYYLAFDIIGKKNPLLLDYLDSSSEFCLKLEKFNEYLERKKSIDDVTVAEFELDLLGFMRIICKYFQMIHYREIEIENPNPWLKDIGDNNYYLLEHDFLPLNKILIK